MSVHCAATLTTCVKLILSYTSTLDTVHTVICAHAWYVLHHRSPESVYRCHPLSSYAYLVSHYFTPLALLDGIWCVSVSPVYLGRSG